MNEKKKGKKKKINTVWENKEEKKHMKQFAYIYPTLRKLSLYKQKGKGYVKCNMKICGSQKQKKNPNWNIQKKSKIGKEKCDIFKIVIRFDSSQIYENSIY
eukprot:990027_1